MKWILSFISLSIIITTIVHGRYYRRSFKEQLGLWGQDDPEMYLNATEIIRERGYQTEEHKIVTSDKYILTVNRINPRKGKPANGRVIMLQHGLLDSAHTWINNPSNESLGFILADEGYDVWIPNSRGSTYSQEHTHLSPKDLEYWEFSWDEMAHYDLPACIDYILNYTNVDKLYYTGHSQGTEIFFAYMSENLEMQNRIAAMVALAPVSFLGNVESPIHYIAPFCGRLGSLIEWFGEGQFMPSSNMIKFLAGTLCEKGEVPAVCSNIIYLMAGYDTPNTNKTRIPIYLAHTPAGTSVQNIVHYCQSMQSGAFQHFNYGIEKNLERYGQPYPPPYPLQKVTVPMAVFWGGKDWLASPRDVRHTLRVLGDTVKFDMFHPNYNHLDFVWGIDAADKIYRPLLEFLANH